MTMMLERPDRRRVGSGRPPARGTLVETVSWDGMYEWRVPGRAWTPPLFVYFRGTNEFYAPNAPRVRLGPLRTVRREIRKAGWKIQ